jgi:hypothetical protein
VNFSWLGFMEMFIVLAFALGWAILELVTLRMDKQREKEGNRDGRIPGPPSCPK